MFLENPFMATGGGAGGPWAGYEMLLSPSVSEQQLALTGPTASGSRDHNNETSSSDTPPSSTLLDYNNLDAWSALYPINLPSPPSNHPFARSPTPLQLRSPHGRFTIPTPNFLPSPPPMHGSSLALKGVEPTTPKLPFLFRGSTGPRVLPSPGDDAELLAYFSNVTIRTVTAIDESGTNFATSFLPLPNTVTKATSTSQAALSHALYSVTLVHSHNFARARRVSADGEEERTFAIKAKEQRGKALAYLRGCAVEQEKEEEKRGSRRPEREEIEEMQLTSAAAMLLVLQAVLAGDSKLVPLLLANAETYVRRLSRSVSSPAVINYMVLHSIYSLVNAVVRGQSLTGVTLLWNESDDMEDGGEGLCASLVKTIMGVSKEMLEILGRAHSLIVRQKELAASEASGTAKDAARWEAVELQADLDTIEEELADEEGSKRRWVDAEKEVRVQLGHAFFRAAIRVYILRSGFGVPTRDERIQACVKSVIRATAVIPAGQEVGLSWPLLIVGPEALGQDREDLLNFVKRCQWKGSAPPLRVEQVLMGAWNEGKSWQVTLEEAGFPLLL